MKIVGIIAGVVLLVALVFGVSTYFGYSNWAVDQEEMIDAQVRQNQNSYSTFTQTAVESMGVTKEYQKAVKDVITAGIEGRYGQQGAKPLALAVREAYPTIDPAMFQRVQLTIESGRRDFSAEQKLLISKVQGYRSELRKAWPKIWLSAGNYPTINLNDPKYNPIVTGATRESFETGTDKGIQF